MIKETRCNMQMMPSASEKIFYFHINFTLIKTSRQTEESIDEEMQPNMQGGKADRRLVL